MRANLIVGLVSFAGSIVLAILATTITQYEGWFWAAAALCLIAAIGIGAQPMVTARLFPHSSSGSEPAPKPPPIVPEARDRSPSSDIKRDVWLRDAIWRAYIGIWYVPQEGLGPNISESEKQRFVMLVIREFRQHAFEGRLPIWGWRKGSNIWDEVPKKFWGDNQIDFIQVAKPDHPEDIKACANNPLKQPNASAEWSHFKTSRAVIERLYPSSQ
jgi:hypothetical protein